MKNHPNKKLYCYYDREADVIYFSQGKPSKSDTSEEMPDDVIVRMRPRTKQIRGFTILNFMRRMRKTNAAVPLPLYAELTAIGR